MAAPSQLHKAIRSSLSVVYMICDNINCFWLLVHCVRLDRSLARLKAGNNMAARMAMMAMTTSNSMRVNPNTLRAWTDDERESSLFITFTIFRLGERCEDYLPKLYFASVRFSAQHLELGLSENHVRRVIQPTNGATKRYQMPRPH